MTDFTYQNGPNLETKSDRPGKSLSSQGIPHSQGFDAADANLVSANLASLRTGIVAGLWRKLIHNPSAPTSGAGEVVTRSKAGRLEASENGGMFRGVLGTVIRVDDFGADPTGATDSTTAVAAAVAALAALPGGGTLLFERGTYMLDRLNLCNITAGFNKTILVRGHGRHATKLQQNSGAGGNVIEFAGCQRLLFRDLHVLTGTGAETAAFGCRTATSASCNSNTFENVHFEGSASRALVAGLNCEITTFRNCTFSANGGTPRTFFWGSKNGPAFTLFGDTVRTTIGSTQDVVIDRCSFNGVTQDQPVIHLHEGCSGSMYGCYVNYAGTGTTKAFVYMNAPTVLQFGEGNFTFEENTFEGAGDAFLFGSGTGVGNQYQGFQGISIVRNWKTGTAQNWVNCETAVADGKVYSSFENFRFEDNKGANPVKLGNVEQGFISHFAKTSTVTFQDNIANGCFVICRPGGLTGTVIGPVFQVDTTAPSGGTGKNRLLFGGGDGNSRFQPELQPMTAAPPAGQLAPGLLCTADGVTWNPTGLNSTGAHIVFYDGTAWRLLSGTVTSVGNAGSTPNAAGASVSGGVLTLQPADATRPGIVSTGTQSFGGNKAFGGNVSAASLTVGSFNVDGAGTAVGGNLYRAGTAPLTLVGGNGVTTGVANVIDTSNGLTVGGDKILSVRNAGVEKASVDKDGSGRFAGLYGAVFSADGAGTVVPLPLYSPDTTGLALKGRVNDGSAAVGVIADNTNTLSTAGAKLLSVRNNSTEKAFVDKDGNYEAVPVSGGIILKSPDGTRYKLTVANGGTLTITAA